MKHFVITGLVAVALLASTQSQAKANGGFGFGFGVGIGISFSGSAWAAPACHSGGCGHKCGPTCCGIPAGGVPGCGMAIGGDYAHGLAYGGGYGYAPQNSAVAWQNWQNPGYANQMAYGYPAYNYPAYGYGYYPVPANVAPQSGALVNAR